MAKLGWLQLLTLLFASILAAPALAATPQVDDQGKFFSKEAVDQANQQLKEIKSKYNEDVLIDTVLEIPESEKANFQALGKEKFFDDWALRRAKNSGVHGIYILICNHPGDLKIELGRITQARSFTPAQRNELGKKLLPLLKPKEVSKHDEALKLIVETIEASLRNSAPAKQSQAPILPNTNQHAQSIPLAGPNALAGGERGNMSLLVGLACMAIVGLLVVWIIIALFRAVTGMGRGGFGGGVGPGGMGMGGGMPGYGGGYGGGGGGGFMNSMLGGMFGAAAGNWMYDSWFRGGSSTSNWGNQGTGYNTGGSYTGAESDPGPGSSQDSFGSGDNGGGDFGDSGGGDFGGGDSGGGGDFGGGGGGDFGGGGGGDFGGGGGDFGGGGDSGGGGGDSW